MTEVDELFDKQWEKAIPVLDKILSDLIDEMNSREDEAEYECYKFDQEHGTYDD